MLRGVLLRFLTEPTVAEQTPLVSVSWIMMLILSVAKRVYVFTIAKVTFNYLHYLSEESIVSLLITEITTTLWYTYFRHG